MNDRASKLLAENIVIDMHIDIPMHVQMRRAESQTKVFETQYLEDIKSGGVNLLVCAVYLSDEQLNNALESAIEQITYFKEDIAQSEDKISLCLTYDDITKAIADGKLAVILALEGLEPIGENLVVLSAMYDLGVRICGLTWSRANAISDGCGYGEVETVEKTGLTAFGHAVIKKCEELGIIVDLTHISEKGFWDVVKIATKPFICSHTNARGICNIVRNFSDEQLKAVKEKGAIVGMNGSSLLVGDVTMEKLVDHFDFVKSTIGSEHIGIGLDLVEYFFSQKNNLALEEILEKFGELPPDVVKNHSDLRVLVEILLERNYTNTEIKNILGYNFMRLMNEVL